MVSGACQTSYHLLARKLQRFSSIFPIVIQDIVPETIFPTHTHYSVVFCSFKNNWFKQVEKFSPNMITV